MQAFFPRQPSAIYLFIPQWFFIYDFCSHQKKSSGYSKNIYVFTDILKKQQLLVNNDRFIVT